MMGELWAALVADQHYQQEAMPGFHVGREAVLLTKKLVGGLPYTNSLLSFIYNQSSETI